MNGPIMLHWSYGVNFTVKFVLTEIKTFLRGSRGCRLMGEKRPVQKEWIICECPNLWLLAELIITISGSNSSVEHAFSLLTRMLSDQRLSTTSHATINMRLSIKINNALWSKDEKEILIERALQIYHEKRHILSLEVRESATKKQEQWSPSKKK